jgi:hypothetical protein
MNNWKLRNVSLMGFYIIAATACLPCILLVLEYQLYLPISLISKYKFLHYCPTKI